MFLSLRLYGQGILVIDMIKAVVETCMKFSKLFLIDQVQLECADHADWPEKWKHYFITEKKSRRQVRWSTEMDISLRE